MHHVTDELGQLGRDVLEHVVIIFTEPWYPLASTAEREIDREVEDPVGDMFNVGTERFFRHKCSCGSRLRRQEGQGRLPIEKTTHTHIF